MSVLVKICGLTESGQVTAAVEAGADAIGFVFAKSIRELSPEQARRLSVAIPAHIRRVAVMRHPEEALWRNVFEVFRPDVIQTDLADFDAIDVPTSIESWPVFREGGVPPAGDLTYIYEGQKSGHGETVDWSRAASLAKRGNMILAGGLSPINVAAAIATVRPFGVDVSSAVESSPGKKDPNLILEFIHAARAAEKSL